jgi:hypothetical protein
MHADFKAAARDALLLFPDSPIRANFLAAVDAGRTDHRRIAHVTRVIGTSRDDEEWSESIRFVEVVFESNVLTFSTYDNHANVIGASQSYDGRVSSAEPIDTETEAKLAKWVAEWRELMAARNSPYGASIY